MFVKAAKVRVQTERAMILMLLEKGTPRATIEKCTINMADDEVSWFDAHFQCFGLLFFFLYKMVF